MSPISIARRTGLALVILMALTLAHTEGAGKKYVDKSGVDILCAAAGGEYHLDGRIASCIFPDGSILTCDVVTDHCSSTSHTPNPDKFAISGELLLQGETQIMTKLDKVSSRLTDIINSQDLLTQQVGLQLACTTADVVPMPVGGAGLNRCDGEGTLHVFVNNQGGGGAVASELQVFFRTDANGNATEVDVPTPRLRALAAPISQLAFRTAASTSTQSVSSRSSWTAKTKSWNRTRSTTAARGSARV